VVIDKNLEVFNFVRIFGMLYLAYTHMYILTLLVQGNATESYLTYGDFTTVLIMSGYNIVDLLFFVSGAVGAFCILTKLDKPANQFNGVFYAKLIAHRFLRLWPMYMLVLFFFWQVSPVLFQGPVWAQLFLMDRPMSGQPLGFQRPAHRQLGRLRGQRNLLHALGLVHLS